MADGRTLGEAWRAIDELRTERRDFVRCDVYEANERTRDAGDRTRDARIQRIEDEDTSKATGNRAWLLNLAGTVVGVIASGIITVLIARGGR